MAFGRDFEDDCDSISDINITPLADVMLVLLIIFIIAIPVITHSVKVDLPRADNTVNGLKPETISLSISADGKIHWNETDISNAELQQRLATEAIKQPQPETCSRGDRKVEYKHVMSAMASVQRAEILKLGFVSDPRR